MRGTDWEPDDDTDENWSDDESDILQTECPYCGESMYEDSPRCPACGRYLSQEDSPRERKPAWILITAVVLLIVMLSWAVNWF